VRELSSIQHRIAVSDGARFLTVGQVRERYGASDSWIVRRTADANFPKPIRFGSEHAARLRRIADLEAWEAERTRINEGVS
jgi:predicted DNA-binding transcriptional regulator AlpA